MGPEREIAENLARISAEEMRAAAHGFNPFGVPMRVFVALSRRLARVLARFDQSVHSTNIAKAARGALADFDATLSVVGTPPRGALLVTANHPGAFDALALLAACERADLLVVAENREFLHAMPHLAAYVIFVDSKNARTSAAALRRAVMHLKKGGAILQFGAGRIEPDPAFVAKDAECIYSWRAGTGVLALACARGGGAVVTAIASATHSKRAKNSLINRLAESRGVTTVALLFQVALPGYRDVNVNVTFGAPLDNDAIKACDAEGATRLIESAARAIAREVPRIR